MDDILRSSTRGLEAEGPLQCLRVVLFWTETSRCCGWGLLELLLSVLSFDAAATSITAVFRSLFNLTCPASQVLISIIHQLLQTLKLRVSQSILGIDVDLLGCGVPCVPELLPSCTQLSQ